MPLLPLPGQAVETHPTAHIQYSELMLGESSRLLTVSIEPSPSQETPWWRLHFGISSSITLCLNDETVRKLSEEIESCRKWYAEHHGPDRKPPEYGGVK